ncbi:MAG: hypothetical protein NTY53_10485, partial [Kiritimatiellaeota bacterium]|nr:hypothetical protein [Kiritimatiellota bacterium]
MSTNRKKLATAVGQLESHLQWLKEEGVRTLAADPKTLSAAAAAPAASTAPVSKAGKPVTQKVPSLGKTAAPAFQPLEKAPVTVAKPATPPPAAAQTTATPVLAEIAARIAICQKCRLGQSRTRTVPGQGTAHPDIMFVGEGPGEDEDRQG